MTAMTCKLNGLFSIGEDFDDEDLLGTDWDVRPASGPTDAAAAAGPTVAMGLRQLSSSSSSSQHPRPPTLNNTNPASPRSHATAGGSPKPCVAQDDFDDWDVDLADLDECDGQLGQPLRPPAPTPPAPSVEPATSAKALRPPTCGGIRTLPGGTSREQLGAARQPAAHVQFPVPRPSFPSAPPQRPQVFPGFTATSPAQSPISRTIIRPQPPQRQWATPGPSPQTRGLFETVSPARSPSPSSSSSMSPYPLHTPVLTNRLVQLVSASCRLPKRPRSEPQRSRTRRFPGPAGFLPQQPQSESLDDVVVSVPHIPAHGAVARSPSQASASQNEEDEFRGGAWEAMKAEMGLDERNPSCFLRSYSVVMVLRKAALKQLTKNKVPNMAVVLKSIIHTHADAKAVFKDPTGEIQGTVHRRLLEDRAEELKVGAVLLLKQVKLISFFFSLAMVTEVKDLVVFFSSSSEPSVFACEQVGVFSPSHRNHYLNVTPNNLLRIYTSNGVCLSSTQLPPLVLEPMSQSPAQPPAVHREPVSRMHLVFDEEDDEGQEEEGCAELVKDPREPAGPPAPQGTGWDADDDLDELLGELPEDTYSL
uniref:Homologous recombination factor with OB-fold n=1 Tax=Scophthalmus maximus TaxID=52904 RepID=A0A8D3AK05_SCOMX